MRVGQRRGDEGVAGLVVGDALLFVGVHDAALALQADGAALDRLVELGHGHRLLAGAGGHQGGLVDEVGQVGADRPRRQGGDAAQVHVGVEADVADVDLEDRLAAVDVGPVHDHLAVEASRPQQGGVERLRPVGGGHDDDAAVDVEAVHLDEQLVERLFALVVAADGDAGARLAQRVQLVDEDDARRPALGLVEQVAHAGGADADEHFDKIGAAKAEERHVGLAGHGLGQQRLAGAGRADEQDALGDAAAEALVLVGGLEEIDDLAQLGDGLVDAGHVLEGDVQVFLGVELGLAAAEGQRRAAGRPAHQHQQPDGDDHDQDHRQHRVTDALQHRLFFLALPLSAGRLAEEAVEVLVLLDAEPLGAEGDRADVNGGAAAVEDGVAEDDVAADVGVADLDAADADAGVVAAGFKDLKEFAVFEGGIGGFAVEQPEQGAGDGQQGQDDQAGREPTAATDVASFMHRTMLRKGDRRPGRARPAVFTPSL